MERRAEAESARAEEEKGRADQQQIQRERLQHELHRVAGSSQQDREDLEKRYREALTQRQQEMQAKLDRLLQEERTETKRQQIVLVQQALANQQTEMEREFSGDLERTKKDMQGSFDAFREQDRKIAEAAKEGLRQEVVALQGRLAARERQIALQKKLHDSSAERIRLCEDEIAARKAESAKIRSGADVVTGMLGFAYVHVKRSGRGAPTPGSTIRVAEIGASLVSGAYLQTEQIVGGTATRSWIVGGRAADHPRPDEDHHARLLEAAVDHEMQVARILRDTRSPFFADVLTVPRNENKSAAGPQVRTYLQEYLGGADLSILADYTNSEFAEVLGDLTGAAAFASKHGFWLGNWSIDSIGLRMRGDGVPNKAERKQPAFVAVSDLTGAQVLRQRPAVPGGAVVAPFLLGQASPTFLLEPHPQSEGEALRETSLYVPDPQRWDKLGAFLTGAQLWAEREAFRLSRESGGGDETTFVPAGVTEASWLHSAFFDRDKPTLSHSQIAELMVRFGAGEEVDKGMGQFCTAPATFLPLAKDFGYLLGATCASELEHNLDREFELFRQQYYVVEMWGIARKAHFLTLGIALKLTF